VTQGGEGAGCYEKTYSTWALLTSSAPHRSCPVLTSVMHPTTREASAASPPPVDFHNLLYIELCASSALYVNASVHFHTRQDSDPFHVGKGVIIITNPRAMGTLSSVRAQPEGPGPLSSAASSTAPLTAGSFSLLNSHSTHFQSLLRKELSGA
jgi:hypothetical protein